MIRQIGEPLQRSLLAQPETGMGYQVVEALYENGQREEQLALNATYLARDLDEFRRASDGVKENFERRLRVASLETGLGHPPAIKSLTLVPRAVAQAVCETGPRGPASDAPESESRPGAQFRRFSAFENDRRVTADGGLVAGTYATTAADADAYVRTGEDAVKRYALPNPTPACHEFVIRPPAKTRIKEGFVQPAYGQPGGGVEVIFVVGSPAKTVMKGRTLPER